MFSIMHGDDHFPAFKLPLHIFIIIEIVLALIHYSINWWIISSCWYRL